MNSPSGEHQPEAKLGLVDAISIIVGIIIGATIYETPPEIFFKARTPWVALALWAVAGLLAFVGALCYAELATAYPRSGGDYNYLTRAYGPLVGYLFGWAQLAVVQTASIGMMAYVFADYLVRYNREAQLWQLDALQVGDFSFPPTFLYATGAVVAITFLNMLGVVLGKLAQNLLTFAKIVGLLGIVVAGFFFANSPQAPEKQKEVVHGTVVSTSEKQLVVREAQSEKERTFVVSAETRVTIDNEDMSEEKDEKTGKTQRKKNTVTRLEKDQGVKVFTEKGAVESTAALQIRTVHAIEFGALASAMVLIFLAYGGYNDAAFVAAEVRNRRRNLPLTLLIGVVLVTLIYLLVNGAYLYGLGFDHAENASTIAADVLKLLPDKYGAYGEQAMCILVMVSALGAVNGLIFTSSRIYSTLGSDYSLFAPLGQWNRTFGTPIAALLLQLLICLGMIFTVSTTQGRQAINEVFVWLGLQPVGFWGSSGFFPLLRCSAPIFWLFFLMTGMALFVLRLNDRDTERPFRVPLYPLVPLLFCATCGYMLWSGINFAKELGLVGAGLVLLGVPFYVFSRRSVPEPTELTNTPIVPQRRTY